MATYEAELNKKQDECSFLKKSLTRVKEELGHVKEQNDALFGKYKNSQEEIAACQDHIAKQSTLTQQQQAELDDMKRMTVEKTGVVDYSKFRVANYQREILLKENEITGLKGTIREKNGSIVTGTLMQDHFKEKTADTLRTVETKDQTISQLKVKIHDLQEELDQLYIKRKVEGTALLQVEHLKADNERLITMLKDKDQYKEFAEFFEDSGGAIKVLPPKTASSKKSKPATAESEQNWVPQDAYKLAHDYLHKHKGNFNSTVVDTLITELNKIWRERERNHVSRLKQKYTTEIADLRRQGAMGNSYNAVDSKKQISRLKTDLKCAYKEIKKNICSTENLKANPKQTGVVDDSLKLANTLRRERKVFTDENERLRRRVEELEGVVKVDGAERARYMEGAAWMANNLVGEADKFVEDIERLCSDYRAVKREKEARGNVDHLELAAMHAKLLDGVEVMSGDFRVKVHGIKGSIDYQAGSIKNGVRKVAGKMSKEYDEIIRNGGIGI